MEQKLDDFLDKEDRYVREDGECNSGAWKTGWCPNCERVTWQQYWAHRGGWVCHDGGEGCGCAVRPLPGELESMDVTADDIWEGKK